MERVHLDMMGPLPESDRGNKYIMVMVDQFSRWVEIQPLSEISAETMAQTAIDHFLSRFGYPLQINTDQGKNFDGNLFKAMCGLLRITKTRTTPYQPCSNGQVERYNRLLLQLICCYISTRQATWDEDLQLVAGAIRGMKNHATGYSANTMMLLADNFQPVNILMGVEGAMMRDENPSEYLKRLRKTLQEVHCLAQEHLQTNLCYKKKTYDLKLLQNRFDVGDFVYKMNAVSKKAECKKLKPIWVGPLLVVEVVTPVLYKVKDHRREYILHHDRTKLCEDRAIPMWLWQLRHRIMDLDTTIGYDEAEQDAEATSMQDEPVEKLDGDPWQPGIDLLNLDCLFADVEGTQDDDLDDLAMMIKDSNHHGHYEAESCDDDKSSQEDSDMVQPEEVEDSQEDEDSPCGTNVLVEGNSPSTTEVEKEVPKMSRRGRTIRTPSHLLDYKL